MPMFAILIDDGELIASDPGCGFADMEAAIATALRTATVIAAERSSSIAGQQLFVCEVSDCATGEHRMLSLEINAAYC